MFWIDFIEIQSVISIKTIIVTSQTILIWILTLGIFQLASQTNTWAVLQLAGVEILVVFSRILGGVWNSMLRCDSFLA